MSINIKNVKKAKMIEKDFRPVTTGFESIDERHNKLGTFEYSASRPLGHLHTDQLKNQAIEFTSKYAEGHMSKNNYIKTMKSINKELKHRGEFTYEI